MTESEEATRNLVPEMLDHAKKALELTSDLALAQRMGVTRQTLSQWRHAAIPMPDERIEQLADLCGIQPMSWLLAYHSQTAPTPTLRRFFRQLLNDAFKHWESQGRQIIDLVLVLVLATGLGAHQTAQAATEGSRAIHYAHRRFAALWARWWRSRPILA